MAPDHTQLAIHSTPPPKSTSQPLTATTSNFLWVDCQDGRSKNQSISRNKRAFVRLRTHHLQRETNLKKLKSSIRRFPAGQAMLTPDPESRTPANEEEHHLANARAIVGCCDGQAHVPAIVQSPQAGIAEAFPSLSSVDNANLYFDYYRFRISKVSFPFSATNMTRWLFRKALDQPALAEVILFLSAGSRTSNLKSWGASTREINISTRNLLQFRSKTIGSLQRILNSSSGALSELTILIITNLLCAEAAMANVEAVDAHILGLKEIISGIGGLDNLSDMTLTTVYCCDLMRGLLKRAPPAFDLSARWVHKIQTECAFMKTCSLPSSALGRQFFTSPWSQDFPTELRSIIEVFRQMIPLYESIAESGLRSSPYQNDHLLLLVHRLYSLPYICSLTPLQDITRLAILLYAVIRIWTFDGKPCIEVLLQTLKQSFEKTFTLLEDTAPDLLFWILFLGVLAARGLPSREWFLGKARRSAERLGLKTWDDAARVLERFFFACRPNSETAKAIWNSEIMNYK